jgi:hypothetical protein
MHPGKEGAVTVNPPSSLGSNTICSFIAILLLIRMHRAFDKSDDMAPGDPSAT